MSDRAALLEDKSDLDGAVGEMFDEWIEEAGRATRPDCSCSSGKYGGSHTSDCRLRHAEREAMTRAALLEDKSDPKP